MSDPVCVSGVMPNTRSMEGPSSCPNISTAGMNHMDSCMCKRDSHSTRGKCLSQFHWCQLVSIARSIVIVLLNHSKRPLLCGCSDNADDSLGSRPPGADTEGAHIQPRSPTASAMPLWRGFCSLHLLEPTTQTDHLYIFHLLKPLFWSLEQFYHSVQFLHLLFLLRFQLLIIMGMLFNIGLPAH